MNLEKKGSKFGLSLPELVMSAVFIALTLVFTFFINIRLPIMGNGGLIHLGNVPLFIGAVIFGRKIGFWAGAVGMGLFDLLSGWTVWAPFTFVVVGLMGYTIGRVTEKRQGLQWVVFAIMMAAAIKVAGYYLAEWIIFGNMILPLGSIPGNLVQVGIAGVITLAVLPALAHTAKLMKIGGTKQC